MTIISFSEVSTFQQCMRQYYYKFTLGLSPMKESTAITTGVNGHKLLEIFYKGIQQGLSREGALEVVKKFIEDLDEFTVEMLKPYFLIELYTRDLDLSNIEAVFVESVFKEDIAEVFDLRVGFTPDLVIRRHGRKLDIEDYKFVGRAWTNSKLSRYSQLNLYNLFLRENGYTINRSVLRFFNTTTNKITYKVYDPSKEELRILRNDFLKIALQVQEFKERPVAEQNLLGTRTFNYNTCQYCPFVYPCSLEAQGKDASKTLATQYKANEYGYER